MDKQHTESKTRNAYAVSLMAILSALGSVACCLPFALLAAFGVASAGAVFSAMRPWLLALSGVLLVIGFVQIYRGEKSCRRRSVASIAVFWMAVAIFLSMLFFPQQFAALLAGHFIL